MTITIFVEPKSFQPFVQVVTILKDLPIDNSYTFTPSDLVFSETMISNWLWISMDVAEYMKLKYCIGVLNNKS